MKIFLLFFYCAFCLSGEIFICENSDVGQAALIFDQDEILIPKVALLIFETELKPFDGLKNVEAIHDISMYEKVTYVDHSLNDHFELNVLFNLNGDYNKNPILTFAYAQKYFTNCSRSFYAPVWLNQKLVNIY